MKTNNLIFVAIFLFVTSCSNHVKKKNPEYKIKIETVLNYDDDYELLVYTQGNNEIDSLKHNLDSIFYVINGEQIRRQTSVMIKDGNLIEESGAVIQIRPKVIGRVTIPPILVYRNGDYVSTDTLSIVVNKPIPDDYYSFYYDECFAILKKYKLQQNKIFIDLVKQEYSGGTELINAFMCSREGFASNGRDIEIININIYKADSPDIRLKQYKADLKREQNINSIDRAVKGMQGIEYQFNFNTENLSITTIAFYGYKGDLFYLIQLQAKDNVSERFERLLQGIRIL